jgi:hypothetical protein
MRRRFPIVTIVLFVALLVGIYIYYKKREGFSSNSVLCCPADSIDNADRCNVRAQSFESAKKCRDYSFRSHLTNNNVRGAVVSNGKGNGTQDPHFNNSMYR